MIQSSIKTFDENKDGVWDDKEISNAISEAKMWAAESKNNNKESFYFGQDKPLDPMNRKEILEVHKKFPQVFISKHNIVPKETKIRIN